MDQHQHRSYEALIELLRAAAQDTAIRHEPPRQDDDIVIGMEAYYLLPPLSQGTDLPGITTTRRRIVQHIQDKKPRTRPKI